MWWLRSFVILVGLFLLYCATTVPSLPEVMVIRNHNQYKKLTSDEKDLIELIMKKALGDDKQDYYFSKLKTLLDTPKDLSDSFKKEQKKEAKRSVEEAEEHRENIVRKTKQTSEEYITREERYEAANKNRRWDLYYPIPDSPGFYVSNDDPLDILVNIRVSLNGDTEDINRILLLEDAIEKHLYIKGFSVNLVFVNSSYP